MSFRLIIKPQAEQDIQDIFDWYERKAVGLGEYFLEDLESKFKKIVDRPEVYQIHYTDFRFAFLERFPVSIHFKAEVDTIYVFGVFPTAENPKKWRGN
ncbi:type II toxin-antitoxin system RelE/ParE family toxin [Algoriphagus taiwanensis]|uniref:Type II toxin-antitoxin system RelE/ParE family toxin n=1 Tax=Algoriphagus taiwanensis TaxID=1445656 RepID=A0ABQ6PXX4_9BACT|nr:type II toxin-antitoxin system RelE/ParE family toxin [Algoriphagus taiwanensis]